MGLVLVAGGCTSQPVELADDAGVVEQIPPDDVTITFVEQGVQTMRPGEYRAITARTDPPGSYRVDFNIIGNALDASLSASSIVASANGEASVILRAQAGPATFRVSASVNNGPRSEIQIAVSDDGFANVHVTPQYDGLRGIRGWSAYALPGATCEDLREQLPNVPPGTLASQALVGTPLVLESVPVGPNVAVFVRNGFIMWGCSDLNKLSANVTAKVPVDIHDAPLITEESRLDVELAFDPESKAWKSLWEETVGNMETAMLNGETGFAAALLTEMQKASSDPAAFGVQATQQSWLASLEQHLAEQQSAPLATLQSWATSDNSGNRGPIAIRLEAKDEDTALLTLMKIDNVDAHDLGVLPGHLASFSGTNDDRVTLGGSLPFSMSHYVGKTTERAAKASVPSSTSVATALAEHIGCATIPIGASTNCGANCATQLCEKALSNMWQRAIDVSLQAEKVGTIPLQVSAKAIFDQSAQVTGFNGTWIGQLKAKGHTTALNGSALAFPAPETTETDAK